MWYLNSRISLQHLFMWLICRPVKPEGIPHPERASAVDSHSLPAKVLAATARFLLTPRGPWHFSGMYEGWITGHKKKDNVLQCWKCMALDGSRGPFLKAAIKYVSISLYFFDSLLTVIPALIWWAQGGHARLQYKRNFHVSWEWSYFSLCSHKNGNLIL